MVDMRWLKVKALLIAGVNDSALIGGRMQISTELFSTPFLKHISDTSTQRNALGIVGHKMRKKTVVVSF